MQPRLTAAICGAGPARAAGAVLLALLAFAVPADASINPARAPELNAAARSWSSIPAVCSVSAPTFGTQKSISCPAAT